MYLRKVDGPRSVRLPDGSVLSRADLPPKGTLRWVASRKAVVARAVKHGLITAEDACDLYALTQEELDSWLSALAGHGMRGLRATVRIRD